MVEIDVVKTYDDRAFLETPIDYTIEEAEALKNQIQDALENQEVTLQHRKTLEELTLLFKCTISEILECGKALKEKAEKCKKYELGQIITESHKICASNCADFAEKCCKLEAKIKELENKIKEISTWYGLNQIHVSSEEAKKMIEILENDGKYKYTGRTQCSEENQSLKEQLQEKSEIVERLKEHEKDLTKELEGKFDLDYQLHPELYVVLRDRNKLKEILGKKS